MDIQLYVLVTMSTVITNEIHGEIQDTNSQLQTCSLFNVPAEELGRLRATLVSSLAPANSASITILFDKYCNT